MLASYRLLSERSRVRLAPGARSNSTTLAPTGATCVANQSAKWLPRRSPTSLKRSIAWSLLPKLFLLAAAFAWFAPGYLAPKWDAGTDVQIMETRPSVDGSPAALLAANDCWTGEAPADMQGVVPGHVVVTVGGEPRVGGEHFVGKALAQIFDGADNGLTVHGFCR